MIIPIFIAAHNRNSDNQSHCADDFIECERRKKSIKIVRQDKKDIYEFVDVNEEVTIKDYITDNGKMFAIIYRYRGEMNAQLLGWYSSFEKADKVYGNMFNFAYDVGHNRVFQMPNDNEVK